MKKQTEKIKRIALLANPEKVSARSLVRRVAGIIERHHRIVLSDGPTSCLAGLNAVTYADIASAAGAANLVLVFGRRSAA